MKKAFLILVFAVSTVWVFNGCSGGSSTKTTEQAASVQYTCSMHPEVVELKPGKCPKCGMDLIEKKAESKQDTTRK